MAACFFPEWGEGCMDAEGTSCTGWYLAEPPKEKVIGRLRIYVDRAVGINKSSLKPIVKLMDKHSGETMAQTHLPATKDEHGTHGTYVWNEEMVVDISSAREFRDASLTIHLLLFIKESRRSSFHTHHDSLAGHVFDVSLRDLQLGGWCERCLKLTPRGCLMMKLRYEASGEVTTEVPLESELGPTGEPLTPFERHLRYNRRRDGDDGASEEPVTRVAIEPETPPVKSGVFSFF